jgi:Mg-chelatase subunit ChlD
MRPFIAFFLAVVISLALVTGVTAQAGRPSNKDNSAKKSTDDQVEKKNDQQESEAINLSVDLVLVPVSASDRNGLFVPDLKAEDFKVYEDKVEQRVEFFAKDYLPFQVVLMLDTSASTQEKLGQIQQASIAFVQELHPQDRVKIISFDDQVRELNDFTSDRDTLRQAIRQTRPGQGTRLYDAVRRAIGTLMGSKLPRTAIVLFTDGVDWRSHSETYDKNIRDIEESGIIVYPIRYDTRTETEALIRDQQSQGVIPDIGIILGGPPTTGTPPTFPGGNPVPGNTPGRRNDPLGLPPVVINRPRNDRMPGDNRYPDNRNDPNNPFPGSGRYPDSRNDPTTYPGGRGSDSTSVMLDSLYRTADQYLNEIATKTGGKLHRADTLISLPNAFAQIAAELRTQYLIGYYPTSDASKGGYRKIKVESRRKGVVIRTRPGYTPKPRASQNK